jgi:hypothetical protein
LIQKDSVEVAKNKKSRCFGSKPFEVVKNENPIDVEK